MSYSWLSSSDITDRSCNVSKANRNGPDRRNLVLRLVRLSLPVRTSDLPTPCFCYNVVNEVMLDRIYDEIESSGILRGM